LKEKLFMEIKRNKKKFSKKNWKKISNLKMPEHKRKSSQFISFEFKFFVVVIVRLFFELQQD